MKVVIIGGSHAGIAAALRLKELNESVEVLITERANELGYLASSLNLYLQQQITDLLDGQTYTLESLFQRGIHILLNTTVTQIDAIQQTVKCQISGKEQEDSAQVFHYDTLILAMGSNQTEIPAAWNSDKILTNYKTYTASLRANEKFNKATTVTIVGAGLIGLELAHALIAVGKKVDLVDQMDELLFRYVDQEIAELVHAKLPPELTLHLGTRVSEVTMRDENKALSIQLANQEQFTTDEFVFAVNPRPAVSLVESFLKLNRDGTIWTNEYLQTSIGTIYAIGDLIALPFKNTDERTYIPLLSNAVRSGEIAAQNIIFPKSLPLDTVQRTIVSSFFGIHLAACGVTEEEAPYFGIACQACTQTFAQSNCLATTDSVDTTTIKLVYEPTSQKILGGQLFTTNEMNLGFINLLSILVAQETTVSELATMDFYFQPVFSSIKHPLNTLAFTILSQNKG